MSWLNDIFAHPPDDNTPPPVKNRPARPEDFAKISGQLGIKLPRGLARIYHEVDGIERKDARPAEVLRLMPVREVIETHALLAPTKTAALLRRYSMVCFWTDDKANYAGAFCGGFLDGRIFFLAKDGYYLGDLSPVYRSTESFFPRLSEAAERNRLIGHFESGVLSREALEAHASRFTWDPYHDAGDASSWDTLPVDYRSTSDEYTENDRVAYAECLKLLEKGAFEADGEREFLVYSLARLVPPDETASLFPFLEEDHLRIPARVAQILVQRDCPYAISHLVTLALTGNPNCRDSVKRALAKMSFQTREAQGAIKAEYSRRGGDYAEIKTELVKLQESPQLFYEW